MPNRGHIDQLMIQTTLDEFGEDEKVRISAMAASLKDTPLDCESVRFNDVCYLLSVRKLMHICGIQVQCRITRYQ